MNGKSEDILKDKIKELKKLFPEAVSEGKVDFEQLKATLGGEINTDNERYVLSWAGKAEAFRVLQQPTTATLAPAPYVMMKKLNDIWRIIWKRLKAESIRLDKMDLQMYIIIDIIKMIICSPSDCRKASDGVIFL
jgi:hypothetical protein